MAQEYNKIENFLVADPPIDFRVSKVTSPIVDLSGRDTSNRILFSVNDPRGPIEIVNAGRIIDYESFLTNFPRDFIELDVSPERDFEGELNDALGTIEDLQIELGRLLSDLDKSDSDFQDLQTELARLQLNIIDEFENQIILEEISKFTSAFYGRVLSILSDDLINGTFDVAATRISVSGESLKDNARAVTNAGLTDMIKRVGTILNGFKIDQSLLVASHFRTLTYFKVKKVGKDRGRRIGDNDLKDFEIRLSESRKVRAATGEPCSIKPFIMLTDQVDEETGLPFKEPSLATNFDRDVLQYHFKRVVFTVLGSSVVREAFSIIRFANPDDKKKRNGKGIAAGQFCNLFLDRLANLLDDSIADADKFLIQTGRRLSTGYTPIPSEKSIQVVRIEENVNCPVVSLTTPPEGTTQNSDGSDGGLFGLIPDDINLSDFIGTSDLVDLVDKGDISITGQTPSGVLSDLLPRRRLEGVSATNLTGLNNSGGRRVVATDDGVILPVGGGINATSISTKIKTRRLGLRLGLR